MRTCQAVPRARRTTITLLATLVAATSQARAQAPPPPAERLQVYSPYEQETIAEVLRDKHLVRDALPEGKIVERVEVVPLPPFEQRDVLPRWLNAFHVTTRESVVRQEMLLREGGRYQQALVDDTIRNLRRLPGVPQLSAVLVVAAAGSNPDRVVVVVITKDVWSLRLNWNVVGDNGGLDQLAFQPSETNFLGTHQILGATFILEPSAYTVGLGYFVPRLGTSRVAVVSNADVMVNRQTNALEGSYGQLVAGEPLYSGRTEWAWDSTVAWQDVVTRRYTNAQLSEYVDPTTGGRLPFQFRTRTYLASYELTRSFGWDVNHDFTLGGVDQPRRLRRERAARHRSADRGRFRLPERPGQRHARRAVAPVPHVPDAISPGRRLRHARPPGRLPPRARRRSARLSELPRARLFTRRAGPLRRRAVHVGRA